MMVRPVLRNLLDIYKVPKADEAQGQWDVPSAAVGAGDDRLLTTDRRSFQRVARHDQPVLVETSLGTGVCQLTNISGGGAMLQGYPPRALGEPLSITLSNEKRLSGVVCWVREHAFGLRFEKSADLEAMLEPASMAAPGQAPREPRVEIGLKVTVEVDGSRRTATLLDISQGGAKLELDQSLGSGDVLLTLPDMPGLGGTIAWRDGTRVGVAFKQAIGFWDLARWVERHQQRLSRATLGTLMTILAASAVAGQAAPNTARRSLSLSARVVDSCIVSGPQASGQTASVTCSGTTRWSVGELVVAKPPAQPSADGGTSQQPSSQDQNARWITITY